MNEYASVCILSYQRPNFVQEAIRTARQHANFPLEIIVHDDGSDFDVQQKLLVMMASGEISKLICNPPGQNQGVGEAVRAAFGAATGDWLVKADQDLLFKESWLRRAVGILENDINVAHASRERIGMVGLFHYDHEPCISSRMKSYQGPGFQLHRDFISSAFVVKRDIWDELGGLWPTHSDAFAEDVEWKGRLLHTGYALALPDENLAVNRGFGVGPSTVVPRQKGVKPDGSPDYEVATIHHAPVIFMPASHEEKVDAPTQSETPTPVQASEPAAQLRSSSPFNCGVVITTCTGREKNLRGVLDSLDAQTLKPPWVVIVYDGCPIMAVGDHSYPIRHVVMPKHQPGMVQPRNVGVEQLQQVYPEANFVWFVDSDVVMEPGAFKEYADSHAEHHEDAIMIGPYDWMAPNGAGIGTADGRWAMFHQYGREHVHRGQGSINVALGCFGGNIVYPIADFNRIGGFWNELYHGRCEDGELGLRAIAEGCGMALVAKARGYHQWHTVDMAGALKKNERDVPMLNARHPWVQNEGYVVTEGDGRRFEWDCPKCKARMNCQLIWGHTC